MQGWAQKSGRVLSARGGRHLHEWPSIGAKSVHGFGCTSTSYGGGGRALAGWSSADGPPYRIGLVHRGRLQWLHLVAAGKALSTLDASCSYARCARWAPSS